jgi:hypothetical protein
LPLSVGLNVSRADWPASGVDGVTASCMLYFFSVADVRSIGTRFMPHFRHISGLSLVTSGCIGQAYVADVVEAALSLSVVVVPELQEIKSPLNPIRPNRIIRFIKVIYQ